MPQRPDPKSTKASRHRMRSCGAAWGKAVTHREKPRGHICDNFHRRVRSKAGPNYHPRRPLWVFVYPVPWFTFVAVGMKVVEAYNPKAFREGLPIDLRLLFPPCSTSREELACVSPQPDERMDVPALNNCCMNLYKHTNEQHSAGLQWLLSPANASKNGKQRLYSLLPTLPDESMLLEYEWGLTDELILVYL